MKNIIKNAITIDSFMKYNNGNLPHIFISKNFNEVIGTINITKYESSTFYQKIIKPSIVSNPNPNPNPNPNIGSESDKIILFKKIINSYENFLRYLDSDLTIDYTYLWDIICIENPLLFPKGLNFNLIILDITSEDATDNIKIICPKQSYSNESINGNKKNLLLIKKDNMFEPIYLINNQHTLPTEKLFTFELTEKNSNLENFKLILRKIMNTINNDCIRNNTTTYNFTPNISLDNVIEILTEEMEENYEITNQIMDYNNKVIGVTIKKENINGSYEHGFIPCYPSALSSKSKNEKLSYKLIDEVSDEDYNDYTNTKELLRNIYTKSDKQIKCEPLYKIQEQGVIVGILTSGNQFVRLKEPEQNRDDELKLIENKDYIFVDKKIQTKYFENNPKADLISNIKLETLFYNNFKNTFKKILNINKNSAKKDDLLRIINNNSMLYLDKLSNCYDILKSIGADYIIFSDMEPIINKIKLSSCFDEDECPENIICKKINGTCSLIIPRINLINKEKNEELYYTRLSDEFVRYNKFRNFIFENSNVYSYGSVEYNITANELLLFQSSLTQDFLKDLQYIKIENNDYITDTFETSGFENTDNIVNLKGDIDKHDTALISKSKYNKVQNTGDTYIKDPEKFKTQAQAELEKQSQKNKEHETKGKDEAEAEVEELDKRPTYIDDFRDKNYPYCLFKKYIITEKPLRLYFTNAIYQLQYPIDKIDSEDTYNICTFQVILIIIKYHNNIYHNNKYINLTIEQLKEKLISLYINNSNFDSLCAILLKNNKKAIIEKVIEKKTPEEKKETMKNCILSNKYYVTYIDIYLLSKEYELPIILLCNVTVFKPITNEKFIIFHLSKNNEYFFLKNPVHLSDDIKKLPNYQLIINASSVVFNIDEDLQYYAEDDLRSKLQNEIANANFKDVLGDYINNYGLNTKEQIAKDKKAKKQEEKKAKKQEEQKKKDEKQQEKKAKKQEDIKKKTEKQEKKNTTKTKTKTRSKRCPNGTHKNKKTGLCEEIQK